MNATTMKKHLPTTLLSRPAIGWVTVLACCLGLNLPSALAAPGSWTRKANMPMAFGAHAACAVNGILYVVGGDQRVGLQLRTLFAYDPSTDTWTRKADMPTARHWLAACAVDGILYAIGGGGYSNPMTDAVEAYDPKTDQWVSKAKLPSARWYLTACAVDGIIYAIGGNTDQNGDIVTLQTVTAYNPKTDQWTPKASLPTPGAGAVAQVVNGLIYFSYGKGTFAYDPKTDRWARKTSIPASNLDSYFTASSAVDGIVYLLGGFDTATIGTYFTLAYDPVLDQFTPKRLMPTKCAAAAGATIAGKIYLTGGVDKSPAVYSDAIVYDSLWVFDPQGGVTPQLLNLTFENTNNVRLAWQGEAGRLYGAQSTPDIAKGPWTRAKFSTGTNSILATNALVEATCAVPSEDSSRFFRILEAN